MLTLIPLPLLPFLLEPMNGAKISPLGLRELPARGEITDCRARDDILIAVTIEFYARIRNQGRARIPERRLLVMKMALHRGHGECGGGVARRKTFVVRAIGSLGMHRFFQHFGDERAGQQRIHGAHRVLFAVRPVFQ